MGEEIHDIGKRVYLKKKALAPRNDSEALLPYLVKGEYGERNFVIPSWHLRDESTVDEPTEDYAALAAALDEAIAAANRVVFAYDRSLAHLKECRFESGAAVSIMANSNRNSRDREFTRAGVAA